MLGGRMMVRVPAAVLVSQGSQLAALLLMDGAAHLEGAISLIEVCPLEAADLSPAQAGGEFRVEEVVPDIILLNDLP